MTTSDRGQQRHVILGTLQNLTGLDGGQSRLRDDFVALLRQDPLSTSREGVPAHLTGSAVVLDATSARTALVLHRKLGQWVQPGGHLEDGDGGTAAGAVREVNEELGVTGQVDPVPVLLSRHRAPCRPGEVQWHFDVQHLVVADDEQLQVSAESSEVAWWPVDQLPDRLAPGVDELVAAGVARLGPLRLRP